MDTVTLRTARLELSPPREGDADAIFAACQDERLQRYTTVPSPYTREHAEGFIEKSRGWWESGSEATWAIRDGDTLVGMIGLHRLGDGTGEIGYWMAAPARGRGLLTEAAHAVIDWGRYAEAFTSTNRDELARDLNTVGVAAMLRGDHRIAESYFARAIDMSSRYDKVASANLAYLKSIAPELQDGQSARP